MTQRLIIITMFALLAACGFASTSPGQSPPANVAPTTTVAFAQQVDLAPLARVAAYTNGRVKSLESFTRTQMQFISGSREINGQTPMFTYFDLMFRPDAYADQDIVYFKNKLMRTQVARALHNANAPGFDAAREQRFMSTGLLAASLVSQPAVIDLLSDLSRNVLTNAKLVDAISNAMSVMNPEVLRQNLRLVAPPGGGFDDRWLTMDELAMAADNLPVTPALRDDLLAQWSAFARGWLDQDAAAVNSAVAQLADLLPQVNPEVYPVEERLTWESWYFRSYNMTWVWIFYGLAMIPLLLGVVFRWPAAHWIGLLAFLVALGAHTSAVGLRWYVAQRWPNSNMFEAITTAAWMGACLALLLEIVVMRKPMRGLFALGASIAGMTAMMAVKLFPLSLSPEIHNMMPVLNDLWLYIHTNVIIFSYCLIFIAAVTAALYLVYRGVLAVRGRSGVAEYARVGGAGSLILTRPDGSAHIDEQRSSLGQILDGTTMVVMELSFVLLWTGIVMGAIWADHSWGRPWGWDPKEVFALNTFLVFLVLVHGRLKVKDKGLWTALLALIGAGVMLFNWIIINFAISGLHSYA